LDRTLDLLEVLSRSAKPMTVAELTQVLGMPKNSVFRIATTLALRGYAEREEETKTYRISPKLLGIGYTALGGERLTAAAGPVLVGLRDATGETALLGTLAGGHGVVLDQVPSSYPVKVVVEIGHTFPIHTAAPAKAMLAFWGEEELRAFLEGMSFPRRTARTLTSAVAYREALVEVRREGFALDRCEESETFACVAAPVFGAQGRPVAAVWISGPSDRVTPERYGEFGRLVRQYAAELSRKLGHTVLI
jgi:IclR family acetate operon transcriptional repressor